MQCHILRAVPRDDREAESLKQSAQQLRIRSRVLHELKAIRAHRVQL
jgi:hypothetical protein